MEPAETCIDGSEHEDEGIDQEDGTTHFVCVRCRFEWYEEDAS